MKKIPLTGATVLLAMVGVAVFGHVATADDARIEQLARQVVASSANIQPGDVVVISGGEHTTALMEAAAIEVYKAGGLPTLFFKTDRVIRARFAQTPERFLDQQPRFMAKWLKNIDVWIGLPDVRDAKTVFAGIPENRLAKTSKGARVIWDMLNDSPVRAVLIGYPTKEEAELNGLDFEAYQTMHWKAVHTDYRKISEQGDYLKNILKGSRSVHLTSPSGTDFTFKVGNRSIFVDDGMVSEREAKSKTFLDRVADLPGGSLSFAPIETSANGKVVIPKDRCRFTALRNVSFQFENGKLRNFKAAEGADCFNEIMSAYSGPCDTFAAIRFGLNPEWKVIEDGGADFRPDDAAGMVTIHTGFNQLLGGKNHEPGGFSFPIVNATVEVDGRVVIKNGKLMF